MYVLGKQKKALGRSPAVSLSQPDNGTRCTYLYIAVTVLKCEKNAYFVGAGKERFTSVHFH